MKAGLERYQRQIMLKNFGEKGQKKLFSSKVLVCGAGGLGSPVLYYLAAAGAGTLGICDFDSVSPSNLNRQILYTPADSGKEKAEAAKQRILSLNDSIKVNTYEVKLDKNNIYGIFKDYDIVVDATDNFESRYLINEAAYKTGLPLVSGAVIEFEGILTTIVPNQNTACFQCVYPFKPGEEFSSKTFGILGAVCGVIGSLQAMEVIKLILNLETLQNKILIFNGIENSYRVKELSKRGRCPVCSK